MRTCRPGMMPTRQTDTWEPIPALGLGLAHERPLPRDDDRKGKTVKLFSKPRRRIGIACTALAMSIGSVLVATPAQASQYAAHQLTVHTRYADQISLCGTNQHHVHVCTPTYKTPNDWTRITGWWWFGTVQVNEYAHFSWGGAWRTTYCNSDHSPSRGYVACYAW